MIKNHKKKLKIKWKNVILAVLLLMFSILFLISIINILRWLIDSINSKNEIKNIIDSVSIEEITDNNNTELISNDGDTSKSNPYWDYIKTPLINVNFDNLKNENSDTIGWIQVKGTNINYPFVQTNNNDFYLEHSFNKHS